MNRRVFVMLKPDPQRHKIFKPAHLHSLIRISTVYILNRLWCKVSSRGQPRL